jgi:hypothetical protein
MRTCSRRSGRVSGLVGLVGAATVLLTLGGLAGACSSTPPFDRDGAVNAVLAQNSQLTRPQAECYVDGVLRDVGSGALDTSTAPPPEVVPKLTRIQVDCIGVANLGTSLPAGPDRAGGPGSSLPLDESDLGGSVPRGLGDDPHLDALYRACQAGSGPSCDKLFDEAPIGSAYEDFASTCGGRTKEPVCATKYPDPPGVTVPPDPTTTVVPRVTTTRG